MLEEIYNSKATIELLRNGPLGGYADELAQHYFDRGYSSKNMEPRFGPFSQFNRLLVNSDKSLQDLDRDLIDRFIQQQRKTKKSFVSSGANSLFREFINLLVRDGLVQPLANKPEFGDTAIQVLLSKYKHYLNRERGLASSSIDRLSGLAKDIIVCSKASSIPKLRKIRADDIHSYIIGKGKVYSTKHVQLLATGLRCFFKYLLMTGTIKIDLAACVPTLKSYRAAHLPEYLEPDQLDKLINSCDRQTATGSRNYAVLLLLSHAGLRASEVIGLTLQDINWRNGEFCVNGKGGKQSFMPLPNDIGKAISDYLIHYRPKVKNPYVFLNTRAPFQQLGNPSTVSSIVRRQLHFADIDTISKGAHLLRYTVATNCLRNGGSLYETCELLRHFSIDTTATYAKIDYNRLSQLAMPWPVLQEVIHV